MTQLKIVVLIILFSFSVMESSEANSRKGGGGDDLQHSGLSYWAKKAWEQMQYQTNQSGLYQHYIPDLNVWQSSGWIQNITRASFRLDMDSHYHPLYALFSKYPAWMPSEDFAAVGISHEVFRDYGMGGHHIAGMCLRVKNEDNGRTVNVIVSDKGHETGNGRVPVNTLDLSMSAFLALKGDFNDNLHHVSAKMIRCDYGYNNVLQYLVENTSAINYYFSVNIRKLPYALQKVEVKSSHGHWVNMKKDSNNRWKAPQYTLVQYQSPIEFRITAIHGSTFYDKIYFNHHGGLYYGNNITGVW